MGDEQWMHDKLRALNNHDREYQANKTSTSRLNVLDGLSQARCIKSLLQPNEILPKVCYVQDLIQLRQKIDAIYQKSRYREFLLRRNMVPHNKASARNVCTSSLDLGYLTLYRVLLQCFHFFFLFFFFQINVSLR